LIQELTGLTDEVFHQPIGAWSSQLRDSLKLAVSLAFEFDVMAVGKISSGWNHRSVLPLPARIRQCFEQRIDGSTLLISANGQSDLALDYCDEGLAIVGGGLAYRGDPEVCLQLVREESKRQKTLRRERVEKRSADLLAAELEDGDDADQASSI
jgi:ABC-type polysaccharide/polyol phosphate transport system ATPase subunit